MVRILKKDTCSDDIKYTGYMGTSVMGQDAIPEIIQYFYKSHIRLFLKI